MGRLQRTPLDCEAALCDEAFHAIEDEMHSRGWRRSNQLPEMTPVRGRFWQSLQAAGDFVATAQFTCRQSQGLGGDDASRHIQSVIVDVDIGVTCPAAERLLRSVGAQHHNAGLEIGVGEVLTPTQDVSMRIDSAEQVRGVVASVTAWADKHAVEFAMARADVGAFIEYLQSQPEAYDFEVEIVPAILAVLGHDDKAREALEKYRKTVTTEKYGVVSRGIEHYLDSGVAEPPREAETKEEDRACSSSRKEPWPTLDEVRQRSNKRREVVKALRDVDDKMTRDEKRRMLRDELTRRELVESPAWIEAAIDMAAGPQKATSFGGNIHIVARIAMDALGLIRGRPRGQDPDWLEPPASAVREIAQWPEKWVAANLDMGVEEWLDRVYRAASRKIGGIAMIKIWLSPGQGTDDSDRAQLVVNIGSRRVGLLDPQTTQTVLAVTNKESLDERTPWTMGRLTRIGLGHRYILEIPVPLGGE